MSLPQIQETKGFPGIYLEVFFAPEIQVERKRTKEQG